MKKIWRVAVIGCGMFANAQYLPNITKEANAELTAVVDIVKERAIEAKEKYDAKECYFSVDELLEKCDFDIAMDVTNIQAHHEINMKVLGAGKHLISQKPAAPDVEMLTQQIELAKKMNVKFVCAPVHPMRYDINRAKQWMADGVIGNPYYIKCNMSHGGPEYFQYRDADPSWFFEPGAGALVDMGVHGLQAVTSIFGPAKRFACMAKVTTPNRMIRSGAFDGNLSKEDWEKQLSLAFDKMYNKANELNGLVSGEHGVGFAKKQYMLDTYGEEQIKIMRGIKSIFDQNGILNPGKLF